MDSQLEPLLIPAEARERVRLLFVAKHVLSGGAMHPEDGNHSVYHHEMRTTLESLGLNIQLANSYDVLFTKPEADFVFPLLNRGGFVNSEMLLPTLCNMHGIPYVGAMPFLRGLGDDKSVSKLVAQHAGVPTCAWHCFRRGAPVVEADLPPSDKTRWVIKPNASSASWGITDAHDWAGVSAAVANIHAQGHDAIVEPYIDGYDIQIPFIAMNGKAVQLPMLWYERADTERLWSHQEKRGLIETNEVDTLKAFDHPKLAPIAAQFAARVAREFLPFDYGRIEFRVNFETETMEFIEINLNCNLWTKKVMAKSAAQAGFSHANLLETILAEAWAREGLIVR